MILSSPLLETVSNPCTQHFSFVRTIPITEVVSVSALARMQHLERIQDSKSLLRPVAASMGPALSFSSIVRINIVQK